jgi:hypothetical protein
MTTLTLDVRAHFVGTGVASYARATGRALDEAIYLKFETYDHPTKEIQEVWNKVPIITDKSKPHARTYSDQWNITSSEGNESLWNEAMVAADKTNKKIKAVFVTIRFGSYDKFYSNSLDFQLVVGVAVLCKRMFSSMDGDESTLIVHMGRDSFHFDNLLLNGTDSHRFSIAPKHPNRQSNCALLTSELPASATEQKQD